MPAARTNLFSARSAVHAVCLPLIALLVAGCVGYTSKPQTFPTLALSAISFNFATVVVGQTATQTLKVSNNGTAPLLISGVSVSNKEFSISGPSIPRTILPGNSLTFTLAFAPTTSGGVSATLKIATNATSAPASVTLIGSGESAFANLVITPASINFGNLALNSTKTQNVTLQNTGDINLAIQGITVVGSGFGYSDLSPGFILAPNQTVIFQIWFDPKVAGQASGVVSLLSPNISSPGTVDLSGDGVSSTSSTPTPTSYTVHLAWGASTSTGVGYRVYRSTVSGSYSSPLNSTATAALSYDDTTVSNGTTYYYVVTAVDASGNQSVYSNQATAVIPAS